MMFKQYLQVTKPGIIFGNLISVIGGFLLASKGSIDYPLFIYTLVGVSLVVASGCVFNNYIDRDIDRKMERTKNRVLVKGLISPAVSLVYATLLGIAGFMLLWFGANPLACWLGVMGFVVYVGVYSLYMKRHSVYGTLIGSQTAMCQRTARRAFPRPASQSSQRPVSAPESVAPAPRQSLPVHNHPETDHRFPTAKCGGE